MSETVWVRTSYKGNCSKVYHTDKTCSKLPADATAKSLQAIETHYSECAYCSGEAFEDRAEQRTPLRELVERGDIHMGSDSQ